MKSINLKGRKVVAQCKYCGSDDVVINKSPVWKDGEWKSPNITSFSKSIFCIGGVDHEKTKYSRASCLTCAGDTEVVFNLLRKEKDFREYSFTYQVEVMERIPIDDQGGYDCLFFKTEFDSMEEIEQGLNNQLTDMHCEVKISKIIKEECLS